MQPKPAADGQFALTFAKASPEVLVAASDAGIKDVDMHTTAVQAWVVITIKRQVDLKGIAMHKQK